MRPSQKKSEIESGMVTAVVRAVQPIVQAMVSTVVQAEVAAVVTADVVAAAVVAAAVVAMVTITCDHRTGSHENCRRGHEQNVFHHISPLQTVYCLVTVLMLMMLHQETPVVQFLLQFGPFLAVFV